MKAAQELEILRSQRKVADYNLDDDRFAAFRIAQYEVTRARSILKIIDKCRTQPAADFRAKIRAHAKLLGLTVSD